MGSPSIRDLVESVTDSSVVPDRVLKLVGHFNANGDKYRSNDFKETSLRTEFLNPVLECLGWDPFNRTGTDYSEREVIQEHSLTIDGKSKAPDYALLLSGHRKFFIEAKRPSVNIESAKAAAFQIRRYCWSANLPFGLVTDFEEFAIYDCRAIPDKNDSPSVGRIAYFTCNDLEENWHLLEGMFGRANVADGILDLLADESKPPKGTRAIDTAFLAEIRGWRHALAGDIAIKNPQLTGLEVNTAVQTLIDRIVFLRNAEARGLEPEGTLTNAIESKGRSYDRLLSLFKRADDRYNSGLFHLIGSAEDERVDRIGLNLQVADDILQQIVGRLYFPEPYEFSVLPADILGRIYEQFLGEHIVIDEHRATNVELKPEFRKSGGVYYTPSPIVDFIVEETLEPLLRGKSPAEVAMLTVLDPAAGSGSFLISAFQYLLDWHRDYYATRSRLSKKFLEKGIDGQTRVKTSERKKILLNNIYGVDIDPQAVEVAKLSLLLKIIEGQSDTELEIGRILPDLDGNILCGNSLIGTDFHMPLDLSREEQLTFNPFDWSSGFPAILAAGGFDAVIGNPPYLNVDATWGSHDPRLGYLRKRYSEIYADKTDLLFYFMQKATQICRGEIAFIVSRSFLEADKAQKLRGWLSKNIRVRAVLDFRHAQVFPKVGINTAIIRMTKSTSVNSTLFSRYGETKLPPGYTPAILRDPEHVTIVDVPTAELGTTAWSFGDADVRKVLAKIDAAGPKVGKILHIGQGMQTANNKAFTYHGTAARIDELSRDRLIYQRARNSDIQRYSIADSSVHMLYVERFLSINRLPTDVRDTLTASEEELKKRKAYIRGNCEWWRYSWPLHREHFDKPRIFCPYLASTNRFALDETREYIGLTDTTVLYDSEQPEDLRYILGVLNSRVLTARFKYIGKLLGGGVLEYYENTVSKLPIPRRSPGDAKHDAIVQAVKEIEDATRSLKTVLIDDERSPLLDQIARAESLVESTVQSLFGLTPSEVELLEEQLE